MRPVRRKTLRAEFLVVACGCAVALLSSSAAKPGSAKTTAGEISGLVAESRLDEATARANAAVLASQGGDEPPTMELALAIDGLINAAWRARPPRDDAVDLAEAVVALKETLVGADAPEVAASLHLFGNLLRVLGRQEAAREKYERALAIREKAYGTDAIELAPTLNNLGSLLQETGDLPGSRRYLELCLAVRELHGAPEAQLSSILLNLGNTLMFLAEYDDAEAQLSRCLDIRERIDGPSSIPVSDALNSLANVDLRLGRYERAEKRYRRALQIRHELGVEDAATVGFLGNLAVLRQEVGDYAEALEFQQAVLRFWEGDDRRAPAQLAQALDGLGFMLWQTGDLEEARARLEQALAIWRTIRPTGDPDTARTLNNLTAVWWAKGNNQHARDYAAEALAMVERTVGATHPEAATALKNLGELAAERGKLDEALRLFERSLEVRVGLVGAEHPEVASLLVDLGLTQSRAGQHDEAKASLERAVALRERFDGGGFPLASALVAQANVLLAAGQGGFALEAALRGESRSQEQFVVAARSLSERHALGLVTQRPSGIGAAIVAASREGTPESLRRAHDAVIRSRALVLDEMLARRQSIRERTDPETTLLVEDLSEKYRRLAQLLLRGAEADRPELHATRVEEARREAETAERAVAARSAQYRAEQSVRRAGFEEVRAALPTGGALVSYVLWDSGAGRRYGAFVLPPDAASPRLLDLGLAAEIDKSIVRWHASASTPGDEADYRQLAAALRQVIWDPVVGVAGRAREFFIVPDGQLHLVGVSALPDRDGRYLVETGLRVRLLSVERDLLSAAGGSEGANSLLALGAPDFDADPRAVAALAPGDRFGRVDESASAALFRDAESAECPGVDEVRFGRLGTAGDEIVAIESMWDDGTVSTWVGAAAGEGRFKREAPGRGALHLATHAFFLNDTCDANDDTGHSMSAAPRVAATNPLLVTGVALAGANRRGELSMNDDVDDGMLTSAEIATLDLRSAATVVLSACETGGGDILQGEGVLGLRRAFLAAGARSVVMSLWRVQDEFTTRWMKRFYQARRDGDVSTSEAVREASVAMLESLRRDGRSTHPFYWGAFVAVGD